MNPNNLENPDTNLSGNKENLDEQKKRLIQVIELLDSQISDLPRQIVYNTGLSNIAFNLEELGMNKLADRIYSEIIPGAIMISIQKAMKHISMDSQISEKNLFSLSQEIGHEARKGSSMLINRFPNNVFVLATLDLYANIGVSLRDYLFAGAVFGDMGDSKKVEEMESLYKKSSDEEWEGFYNPYWKTHLSEICEEINDLYTKFINLVKDTPEYKINPGQVCLEIRRQAEEKLDEIK